MCILFGMTGSLIVILPFIQENPYFLCPNPKNLKGDWIKCESITDACSKTHEIRINYDKSPLTITTEFKLYCDDAWKKGILGTAYFTAGTISTLFFGIIANKYGRKIVLFSSMFLGSIGMIVIGFAPNYWSVLLFYGMFGISIPLSNFSSLWLNEIGDDA